MLLGKRPRAPMKRTTSMSQLTLDLNTATVTDIVEPSNRPRPMGIGGFNGLDQSRIQRTHSAELVIETPEFLRACSLCKRPLVPGRDIYMYRGDSAFCSLECRQQQMNQDERKEKFFMASKKQVVAPPPGSQVANKNNKGETVVAL